MAPTFRFGAFRVRFYARDRPEPPHVHVRRDNAEAKVWLESMMVESSVGFSDAEIRRIQRIIEQHQDELLRSWHEFFEG